jgi:hypothetical protein
MLKESRSDRRAPARLKLEHTGQEHISSSTSRRAPLAQPWDLEIRRSFRLGFRSIWADSIRNSSRSRGGNGGYDERPLGK